MSAAVATRPALDVAPLWRMIAAQTRATLLFYWRVPTFFIFSMALPVMFYLFFGLPFAHQKLPDGTMVGTLVMAHMGAYAVSSVLVFNIGIGRANNRAQKLDLLQRATPLPAWVVILADAIGATALSLVSLVALFVVATLGGGVSLSAGGWVLLTVRLVLGALPLLGLGLAIGYGSGPNAAPAICNLIYLPMSFASGLFIPLRNLPDFIHKIAPYLPTYHYSQLVDHGLSGTDESVLVAVAWLIGWGLLLFGAAARVYRLDQAKKFS
jgi:ABC-2 type transport system permease protein